MTRNVRTLAALPAIAFATFALAAPAQAADYKIDPAHTFVTFEVDHLGVSTLYGRFNSLGGSFSWDDANPGASTITMDIDPASVDTNHAERDKHLRSADFLDVENHKAAGFKSTAYQGDASGGTLTGDLTLLGVTKPISIDVKFVGQGPDPWGNYRAGFTGTTSIRRADFGIDYNLGPAAETVTFELNVEGIRE